MEPKILVGCPTYDGKEYCLEEYIEGLYSLSYKNFDICLVDNSKKGGYFRKLKGIAEKWNSEMDGEFNILKQGHNSSEPKKRIVDGRNLIRDLALKKNYDFFLSLEQDVIPPKDFIQRLLERNQKVISGTYFNLVPELNSLVILAYFYRSEEDRLAEKTTTLGIADLAPSRVIENLRATGIGCMLIKNEVLREIEFRFVEGNNAFDDWWFCTDALGKGYSISLDTGMLCKHLYKPWVTEKKIQSNQ